MDIIDEYNCNKVTYDVAIQFNTRLKGVTDRNAKKAWDFLQVRKRVCLHTNEPLEKISARRPKLIITEYIIPPNADQLNCRESK